MNPTERAQADERNKVQELQLKHDIKGQFNTLAELRQHLREEKDKLKKQRSVAQKKGSWVDGYFDTGAQDVIDAAYDVFEIGITQKEMKRLSTKVPFGAILTFGVYRNMLNSPNDLRKEINYLHNFFWKRGLMTPPEIGTGVTEEGKKKTGGYTSVEAKKQTGSAKIVYSDLDDYPDAVPYGYSKNPSFVQDIVDTYVEIKTNILNHGKV